MRSRTLAVVVSALCAVITATTAAHAQAPKPNKAVNVCALLTPAEAGAVLGTTVGEATPDAPQGSLLGGCKYVSMKGIIMLSARPVSEFDATVKAYKDFTSVSGVGEGVKASYSPTLGMLMSQSAKPYFLQISIAGGSGGKTSERFVAVAKKVVAKG